VLSAINIKTRLILLLVAVGLIPLTVVSLVLLERAQTALSNQAFDHLDSISHTKKGQLEQYIERINADISVLAGSTHLADAMDAFASVVDEGAIDPVEYDYFESLEYGSSFRKFIAEYGYYDLMLITSAGDIVYSTRQESDLAQNVRSGTLAETLLGKAFEQGMQRITVTDFQLYAPSDDQLMAFLFAPVKLRGEETLGAVVLKVPHQQIANIMLDRVGMGESSEAYLVGPDLVMRSDAHLDPEHRTVLAAFRNPEQGRVETASVSGALAGRSGRLVQDDYRGVSVLASYTPVQWGDISYALTAEEDTSEAFGPIVELRRLMIYTVIALFALILLAALFLATIITRPIRSLTDASIDIAEGDLEREVRATSHDELGTLAENFNRMRLSIAEKIALIEKQKQELNLANEGLEDLVTQRTAALKESQERFELAVAATKLGLWDWQPHIGKITVSDGWSEMLGYSKSDISESDSEWFDRLHPDDRERTFTDYQGHADNRTELYRSEFRMRAKDGSYRWILATGKVIDRDLEQNPTRMIGTHMDITDLKTIQTELASAKEAAEGATRAKSDFLSNMSHEIRTPMNAIIGLSHLALGTELTRKQQDYLSKISSSANNLLGIINDILDFSKIEAGKLDMECVDFDLIEVLDNFANVIAVKASEKGLELIVDLADDVPMGLKGDPLRLNQILINLANNAVKFTEKGEIAVRIEVLQRDVEDVQLRFAVRDTGIGMNEDQRGKLFQAFSQADSSTSRKFGGTGLGLSISKRLVELMDGEIGVASQAAVGSEFHFTARFGIGTEPSHRGSHTLPDDLQDLRVLVVDDNPTSRTILVRYLESFGFRCDSAMGGEQALAELEAADPPYRLVLMDWKMPGMDGIETTRRIRTDEKLATMPQVLMVSAYGREELREAAEDVGIQVYLVKPVNPSTLLDATLEAVGHQPQRGSHEHRGTLAAEHIRGAHLLLVEDNEINQQVATELLEQAGLEVTIAHHGREALDMLGAGDDAFDGVLMDIQMPVMDGYTAAREIRKDPRFDQLPIVAMTANAMVQDREQALKAGMNDHVAKPIDVKDLFEVLGRWIDVPEKRRIGKDLAAKSSSTDAFEESTVAAAEIPKLEGIDTKDGLKRMGGNKALYLKILRKFRDSQADAVKRIRSAAGAGDMERAGREAHTLKGLAGNVGAQPLYQAAERVERLFRNAEAGDSIRNALTDLDTELSGVTVALGRLAANDAASASGKTSDIARVPKLLVKLRGLLESDDADATDVVDELTSLMVSSDYARHIARLAERVDEYDYDEALELLEEIERSL